VLFKNDLENLIGKRPFEEKKILDVTEVVTTEEVEPKSDNSENNETVTPA
jgi:hypothetical protein